MINTKIIYIILLAIIILSSSGCLETGRSAAVDTIYDVGYNNLPWKTGFIYLTNDHPAGPKGTGYSAVYTFNKSDVKLFNFLSEARDNKRLVKLYYTNNYIYLPWEYQSDAVALVYKAEYVNTTK